MGDVMGGCHGDVMGDVMGTGLLTTLLIYGKVNWRCFLCQEKRERKAKAKYII